MPRQTRRRSQDQQARPEGATWNANSLISGHQHLRAKKLGTLTALLEPRDIIVITEKYSAKEHVAGAETRVNPADVCTFWSHGSKAKYGPSRPAGMEDSYLGFSKALSIILKWILMVASK